MTEITTMNSDHAYIHQEWHRAASTRDTLALFALYADDAILESPLVPVVLDGKSDGVLRGKGEIGRFLTAGARSRPIDLVRWYRSGHLFQRGRNPDLGISEGDSRGRPGRDCRGHGDCRPFDPASPHLLGLERMSADRPKADPSKRLKMRGQAGKCLAANVIGRRPHA